MKKFTKFANKLNSNVDPEGRTVIGCVETIIEIVVENASLAAKTYPAKFPGRKQFLADVEELLKSEGCQIVYSEESNRPEDVSISIYFVLYYPVDDNSSIMVTALLKVSDHQNSSYNTIEFNNFKKKIRNKYMHSTSQVLQDPIIIMQPGFYNNYPEAMSDVKYQLEQHITVWRNTFKRKGRV